MILGFDISHFQQGVNFPATKAAARAFVVLKATEGIGYVDPSFAAYRRAAHAAGLIVGIYHFGRDNAPTAEAAYFAGVVGALQANEFLVLDQEVTHAGGNVPWCTAWLDATRVHYGVAPLIYMNQGSSTGLTSGNWTQVAQTYGLWAAIYDNSTTQPTVPYWGAPAMKQYSDAGSVLGVGTCDVDVFYGTAAQLLAYGSQGAADMPLTPADVALILDTPIARKGGAQTGTTTLRDVLAWSDSHIDDTLTQLTGKQGTLNGDLRADLSAKGQALAAIQSAVSQAQAPTVDAKALADALVADTGAVATLADALAAAIAKRLGNG